MADGAADLPLASHVSQSSLPCDACAAGKSHRQPVSQKAIHRATRCLELVHSDMWGPIDVDAHGGWTGFLTFIDDFSREVVVYLMKGKSGADVLTHLTDYKAWAENITGQRLTALRTDNGGEFINRAADHFLRQHGVTRQVTTAYTSSQNGVAERFNRTIMDTVRSMLHHANLADSFWPLAVQAATYVRNRCPTAAVQHMTPHQAWYGHRPELHSLRVFGCVAHLHIPAQSDDRINKLSARSVPCINVGYSLRSKAYLLYNPRSRRVHTSKDVTFEENRFIGADSPLARCHIGEGEMSVLFPDVAAANQRQLHVSDPLQQLDHEPPAIADEHSDDELVEAGLADYSDHELEQSESDYEDNNAYDARSNPVLPQERVDVDDSDDALDRMPLSVMARRYGNAPPAPPALRRSQRGGGLPSSRALDSSQHARILHTESASETCGDDEPSSYTEAMSRPDAAQWRAAIDSELDSLKRTGTWTLTPLVAGRQAIGSRWVLKIKRKADGTVDKYKARLVAKGYAQKAGIDYDETFAPVAKFTSIRMLLALAAHHDFEIHQMDVKTAFLNGDLDVDIYMEQPEGYSTAARGEQRLVCKLQKALYGLKQAGRAWNEKILDALLQLQFTPLDSDSCVFVHRGDGYVMFIVLYVDDLLIISSSLPRLVHLKSKLSQLFEMTDMGEAHYILGLKIIRNRSARQLSLSQQEYVRRVVERYGMTNCNPATTPLTAGTVLSKDDCPSAPPATPVTINGHTYASIVGAIMYAMLGTRPDLAYAVGCLSRFNSNPGATHVTALKHVLRYLAGTTDYQLVYGTPSTSVAHHSDSNQATPFVVFGYCDSDYAACVDERLSVAGWVFMAAGGATSWQSQKQKSVALSTVEAEYMAACSASKEAVWQRAILAQAGVSTGHAMLILTDNQGAMGLAKNPNHHQRSKHIDVRYHYVRQQVARRTIRLDYVATADQAADQLTKPLSKVQHDLCLAAMGIRSTSASDSSPLKLYTLRA
jgi:hypothetical protein